MNEVSFLGVRLIYGQWFLALAIGRYRFWWAFWLDYVDLQWVRCWRFYGNKVIAKNVWEFGPLRIIQETKP